ncbi:steroidogenic acute regulatory protein-like isoform X2 [Gigantopelta aegis]|nr:steroidogenic acute regulatory protein-like isoform X2 [Gigantopelta aegis]
MDSEETTKMSAVRRTFCLFVTFDLIFTFILWVIYTQLIGDKGFTAFNNQVAQYDFRYSLFDSVMMAAVRLTFLLLAYALCHANNRWTVALTTLLSCIYLICKIFLFDFGKTQSAKNPLSYLVLIISFVLAWAETWWLDFRVLPHEKKMRERARSAGHSHVVTERTPLLPGDQSRDDPSRYYSPVESPEHSDDENQPHKEQFQSPSQSRGHSRQPSRSLLGKECNYESLARGAWDKMWTMVNMPDSEWKHEMGSDNVKGWVHTKHFPHQGKVFRLQGLVDMNVNELFEEVTHRVSDSPQWNPTVMECRTLEHIDDSTEVSYTVSAEAGGGLITSRDFVTVRRWGSQNGIYMSAGQAATHPEMPPQKKHIRGENGIGGWVFKPVPGQTNKCYFEWYLNTHLKGWLPQKLIDTTLSNILVQYLEYLRRHVDDIKQRKGES